MSHVDEGTLHAYLDGELAPVERERVDTHLKGCPACQARLAAERAILERASRLLGMATPPERAMPPLTQLRRPPVVWRLRRPLAWAATLILAVGLGWFARDRVVQQRSEDSGARLDEHLQLPGAHARPSVARGRDSAFPTMPAQGHLALRRTVPKADSISKDRDVLEERQLESAAVVTGAAAGNAVAARDSTSVAALSGQKVATAAQVPRATPPSVRVRGQAAPAAAAEPQAAPTTRVDGVPLSDAAAGVISRGGRRATPIMSTSWPIISRQPARDVLGVEPVTIPGFAVRAYRRNPAAREIVVEQVTDAGTTISFVGRRVDSYGYADRRADSAAANAPSAMAKSVNERLARFVGLLRVEIDGPLTPDSLSSLLELAH